MTEHEIQNDKVVNLFPSFNVLKQKLYCIVDFKSLTILPPFLAQNDEEAKRNFTNLINYSNSTLCRFPDDFKLYCIGDYVVSFTGSFDKAREELQTFVGSFQFVTSADCLKQPDTIKFDELHNKVEESLKIVSNSNNVLLEQIGNVPNLEKSFNLLSSKFQQLSDKVDGTFQQLSDKVDGTFQQLSDKVDGTFQQLSDKVDGLSSDDLNLPVDSKESFFDKLFL